MNDPDDGNRKTVSDAFIRALHEQLSQPLWGKQGPNAAREFVKEFRRRKGAEARAAKAEAASKPKG